tara:strand:+ start:68684 stop:70507 length:1824 start_codon:yes stop_codon:yes gene_type:complete
MIFNILIVGLVLGLAYAWMVRGFFSAFIHLLCVLVAGALAFAVWEPASYFIIGLSPDRGFLSFLESAAWGLGLILPFSVFLLVARFATDKIVGANLKNASAVDYAGGAVCGLGVGVLTAGVFVIGIQGLRLPTNMGYRPVWYTEDRAGGAGSLTVTDSLWIPADRITAGVYRGLSSGSMSAENSLDKWYPDLVSTAFAARLSPGDGSGRNAIRPSDFRVIKTYTVATPDQTAAAKDLLTVQGSATPQRYVDVRGRAPGNDGTPAKGYLMGAVIEFEPGAKERGKRGGQVIVSNGQVHMIARNDSTGESITIFPLAAISENAEADGRLGRWKFDANDVFISSVGGQSKATIGFEFFVPEGYNPIGLSVRQARVQAADEQSFPAPIVYESPAERDRRIASGSIFKADDSVRIQRDASNAVTLTNANEAGAGSGVRISSSMGEIASSQTARSRLTLDDENLIADGQAKFAITEVGRGNTPSGRSMRVESFALGRNQTMVQIDVSPGMPASFTSDAARLAPTDQPLVLIDSNGNEYEAIGFVYKDREIFEVRYTLGNTLAGIEATPPVSTARDDQKLVILFVVTRGVSIEQFAAGNIVIATMQPPLEAVGG